MGHVTYIIAHSLHHECKSHVTHINAPVCCSVLHCVAVCCGSVLQCVCSVLQCVAVCCGNVLQCVCSVLQCVAKVSSHISHHTYGGCNVLQCVAVCCSVLQCVAVCCSVLQCVAKVSSHISMRHYIPMNRVVPCRT